MTAKTGAEALRRLDNVDWIENDRQLLEALGGMTDSETAFYLGRSRQALNSKLGSKKKAGQAPDDYFKLGEISLLVLAARQLEKPIDGEAILKYAARTRKGKAGTGSYEMLEQILGGSEPLKFDGASAVILLIPDYTDLLRRPEAERRFEEVANALRNPPGDCRVALMSTTRFRAEMAQQGLKLKCSHVYAGSHEYVDHYVPLVLIFDEGKTPRRQGDTPRAYSLTDHDSFVAAPEYSVGMMSECILFMLPDGVRDSMFPEVGEEERLA